MKRITEYRKLFGVEEKATLKELKTNYRNLVKEWHPDKFRENDERAEEAEAVSRKIIDGYHFLVSIAPETREANLEQYNITISETGIADYFHKGLLLEVTFLDGCTYEYFGVPKTVFIKFHNSDKQYRFGRRSIFNSYLYRKSKKTTEAE